MSQPASRECPLCGVVKAVSEFISKPHHSAHYVGECRACYLSGRRGKLRQAQRRVERRKQVFDHYGWSCACCGSTEHLAIDHVNGDGLRHRKEVPAERLYAWLIKNGFPADFQTLCKPCNSSKRQGRDCLLHGRAPGWTVGRA